MVDMNPSNGHPRVTLHKGVSDDSESDPVAAAIAQCLTSPLLRVTETQINSQGSVATSVHIDELCLSSALQVMETFSGRDAAGSLLSGQFLPSAAGAPARVQIAVTGSGLKAVIEHSPSLLGYLVRHAQVFARMKPADKKMIVEILLEPVALLADSIELDVSVGGSTLSEPRPLLSSPLNPAPPSSSNRKLPPLQVMFCGDGANDMAALRAATVGLSLCDAETSVAAPVTSKLQTPGAVIDVIREGAVTCVTTDHYNVTHSADLISISGRSSLVTAYVLVNFNIMYGVIQLYMTCQLYSFGLKAGNYMYLIQDLFFTLVLGIAISVTPSTDKLSVELPPQRFFSPHLVVKLFSQLVCFPAFQSLALYLLSVQNWYKRYESYEDPLSTTYSHEASALSSLALAQLMIASVASTIDEPFRKPWYTNRYHLTALTCQLVFLAYQLFSRSSPFNRTLLEIEPLPYPFCGVMVALMVGNCVVSMCLAMIANALKGK